MSRKRHHHEEHTAIAPRAPRRDTSEPHMVDTDILDDEDVTTETDNLPPVAAEPMQEIPPSQANAVPASPILRPQDPAGTDVPMPSHPLVAEPAAVTAQPVMVGGSPAVLAGPAVVSDVSGAPIRCRVRRRLGAHGLNILGHVQELWEPDQVGSFTPDIIASAPHCFEKLTD